VASGIARYLNADVTLAPVIIAALAMFTFWRCPLHRRLDPDPADREGPADRCCLDRWPPVPLPLTPDPKTSLT